MVLFGFAIFTSLVLASLPCMDFLLVLIVRSGSRLPAFGGFSAQSNVARRRSGHPHSLLVATRNAVPGFPVLLRPKGRNGPRATRRCDPRRRRVRHVTDGRRVEGAVQQAR